MANPNEDVQEPQRSISPSAQPAVRAPESAEKSVADWLLLPHDQRIRLFEELFLRVLPRLDGVDPGRFLESLRTVPREDARLEGPEQGGERAESYHEVLEDVLQQPLGAQKRILELAAPRIVSGMMPSQREAFLHELRTRLELAGQGALTEDLMTRH